MMPWQDTFAAWSKIPVFKGILCVICRDPYKLRFAPPGKPGWVWCKNCGRFQTDHRGAVLLKSCIATPPPD